MQQSSQITSDLQHSGDIAKLIVRRSPLGIFLIDKDLRIRTANPAFCEIVGYDFEQILGRRFTYFTHPEDVEKAEKMVRMSFSVASAQQSLQKRMLHTQRHIVPVMFKVAGDGSEQYDPEFSIVSVENLTQQVEDELKIRSYQDKIYHLERQMSLNQIASGLAHDLNQPLTAISAYSHACSRLMSQGSLEPKKICDALEKLSKEAHRVAAVTEDIRELVRGTPKNIELFDGNEIMCIAEYIAVSSNVIVEHLIVRRELAPDLPMLRGAPEYILLVLICLLRNALTSIKKTQRVDRNEIMLSTGRVGSNKIYLSVADSGIGIGPAIEADLFRPFLPTTINSKLELGLSISKSIMDVCGGELSYCNNASGGATFSIVLPLSLERK